MTLDSVLNLIMTILLSGLVGVETFLGARKEQEEKRRRNISPYIVNKTFPYIFGMFLFTDIYYSKGTIIPHRTISIMFSLIVQITIYYLLLALTINFIRKHFYARTCALLWLLPTMLYYVFYGIIAHRKPLFIIHGNGRVVWYAILIWMAGAVLILLYKTLFHLLYRYSILRDAYIVSDEEAKRIWKEETKALNYKLPFERVMISPHVFSPLTIGLIPGYMKVILPEKQYYEKELRLIFRHELIHIKRADCWTKFFLTFLTAICWFNPLIWMAMKKSAEDMELSCDEAVLIGETKDTRKMYAELLLSNVGEQRGYTTCLSVSAQAMRYRLRSIVNVTKKKTGCFLSGAVLMIMILTFGLISISYGEYSGKEALFYNTEVSTNSLSEVYIIENGVQSKVKCTAEKELIEYISNMSFQKITGRYQDLHTGKILDMLVKNNNEMYFLSLSDKVACIKKHFADSASDGWYYVEGDIDWDYIDTLLG